MAFYVICDDDSKHEGMTKEQILAAIAQAIETGNVENCDTGFITKIKEQNGGGYVTFWVGTQAQYNALAETATNCLYIITDDTSTADTKAAFEAAVKAAADAAKAAEEVASTMRPIDITDRITLTNTMHPDNATDIHITRKKYVYSPAVGAVFFEVSFMFKGSVTTSEDFIFEHAGGYVAEESGIPVPCLGKYFRGELNNGNELWITPTQDCGGADAWGSTTASGWYLCKGEGV